MNSHVDVRYHLCFFLFKMYLLPRCESQTHPNRFHKNFVQDKNILPACKDPELDDKFLPSLKKFNSISARHLQTSLWKVETLQSVKTTYDLRLFLSVKLCYAHFKPSDKLLKNQNAQNKHNVKLCWMFSFLDGSTGKEPMILCDLYLVHLVLPSRRRTDPTNCNDEVVGCSIPLPQTWTVSLLSTLRRLQWFLAPIEDTKSCTNWS